MLVRDLDRHEAIAPDTMRNRFRATCDAVLPGRDDSATIRSFSSRLQRRRRSTDVITSTAVIALCLLSQ